MRDFWMKLMTAIIKRANRILRDAPSCQSITLIWAWRKKSVSHHLNKLSIISNGITVTCGVDGCGGVMLWLPTADALTPANYECYTPQARRRPTSLFTPRCCHGNWLHRELPRCFISLAFHLSTTKWEIKCLNISSYLCCSLLLLFIITNM